MRAVGFAFTIALSSPFLLHSGHAEPADFSLSPLCEDVLERYSATAEESFRAILKQLEPNAETALGSKLSIARFPLLRTLTDFFVFLVKSEQHQSFQSRSASALIRGGRSDLVQDLAADPDAPGQRWALQALGMEAKLPLERLYFAVVENTSVHYEARRTAVSALRSRLWKMEETSAEQSVFRLLALLRREKDSLVASEMTSAILYKGSATSPDVLEKVFQYLRDPSSQFARHMVRSLSFLIQVPSVRLLFLDLAQSATSQEIREGAMTALGRTRGSDAAWLLEEKYRSAEDPHERKTSLRSLVDLAQIEDQDAFETLIKLFHEGKVDVIQQAQKARAKLEKRPNYEHLTKLLKEADPNAALHALMKLEALAEELKTSPAEDQSAFNAVVKAVLNWKEKSNALMNVVDRWNAMRAPEWLDSWSSANVSTWGSLLHTWVELLDDSDRYCTMTAFERVWDFLPARDSDATTFSQLGLVWDESANLSGDWRAVGSLFGVGLSKDSSVRRIRKPTQEEKTLFHLKINDYIDYLEQRKDKT